MASKTYDFQMVAMATPWTKFVWKYDFCIEICRKEKSGAERSSAY